MCIAGGRSYGPASKTRALLLPKGEKSFPVANRIGGIFGIWSLWLVHHLSFGLRT